MQSVDLAKLESFSDDLQKLLDEAPEERKKLHERIAEAAKRDVDRQIRATVGGDNSKIAGWQEPHVGSGGGYAAVRATSSSSGDNSPGAVTNYLENGHKIRPPSGHAKQYRPEIRNPYVDGKHFYLAAQATAESDALSIAESFADRLAERLEEK